jgi:hypothetical protein
VASCREDRAEVAKGLDLPYRPGAIVEYPMFARWAKLRAAADGSRNANMPRIDDLSDAEFMKLQAEYGDSLPICPICTLEDVRHLLLELVAGDAVSDEVKNALAPVLYAVTGALVADRTMAEQGDGSAHLGGDEDYDDDGAPPRTQ